MLIFNIPETHTITFILGTTLQDLTEAALEEIERQEAAMESLDGTEVVEGAVVQEIGKCSSRLNHDAYL